MRLLSSRTLLALLLLSNVALGAPIPIACPAPPAVLSSKEANIFTEQQEQWLGDAMADYLESQYRPVKDPAESAYLGSITKRLLAALPPTQIQFRVLLVDSSEINGFSLAGGRVYITRKLVANARSEDEVASVVGHELGHILSHQFAIETTADLQRLLHVTAVTDRADIYTKFGLLLDARMKDKHAASHETDKEQDEADLVGVYATASAGYRPQAYAEFWDRSFFVDGKVGGRFSDFFGATKPESKRLRNIRRIIAALPPGCGSPTSMTSAAFDQWRAIVIANQAVAAEFDTKPVAEVALTPPLRMDLEQLRFSRDGRYILAQDESSVFVLSRDPYRTLFRFDADRSLPAEFSPDSQRIVFHTPGLHAEEWSIADHKLLASHELVARHDCLQTRLSPDGRTLVCISMDDSANLDVSLLDTSTGDLLLEKKHFFLASYSTLVTIALNRSLPFRLDWILYSISADGNVLLIGPGQDKLAFDLRTRTLIPLGAPLRNRITGTYAFLGNNRVVGINIENHKDSGIFSFPDGRQLQKMELKFTDMQSVSSGPFVLNHELKDYAVGAANLETGKFAAASKNPSMDIYDTAVLSETGEGGVLLSTLGASPKTPPTSVMLPLSPLGSLEVAEISPDGRYLALSTHTRGGVWEVATGKRLANLRGFTGATFGFDNALFAEFPKLDKIERSLAEINLSSLHSQLLDYKENDATHLSTGGLREWKKAGKSDVELVVHDPGNNVVLWSRVFEGGQPAQAPNVIPGQTVFSFPIKTPVAKALLKLSPALSVEAAQITLKDAGRLIQLVDDRTGKVLHEIALEVPDSYEGVGGLSVVGDLLYLSSVGNRTKVYALSSGAELRQIFGYVLAADQTSKRICTLNRRDEAVVYDSDGNELSRLRMGSPLRLAFFIDSGSRVDLLTADQKLRTMGLGSTVVTDIATARSSN